jgi:hypothetical protein
MAGTTRITKLSVENKLQLFKYYNDVMKYIFSLLLINKLKG